MEKVNILIIEGIEAEANFFKKIILLILPTCEVTIDSKREVIAKEHFSVILLDSAESLNRIPKEQYKDVIVCSRDNEFVMEALKKAETNIILRTADFYDAMLRFFSLKQMI